MPLSRPDCLPRLLNLIWDTNPQSVLDVGIGFGKMGVLIREGTDIRWGRIHQWETVIHGIEIEEKYRNPIWTYVYNLVRVGDALKEVPSLSQNYEIVILSDVLEHLEKERALKLLEECIKKATKYVIVTTPSTFHANEEEGKRFGSEYQVHRCILREDDFPEGSVIEEYGTQKIIIIKK